jgi:hypothetical protein
MTPEDAKIKTSTPSPRLLTTCFERWLSPAITNSGVAQTVHRARDAPWGHLIGSFKLSARSLGQFASLSAPRAVLQNDVI